MDKNFVYTCVKCRLSDTIDKDTAQCKQGKFSDQLIVNKTQAALEVGSYQYCRMHFFHPLEHSAMPLTCIKRKSVLKTKFGFLLIMFCCILLCVLAGVCLSVSFSRDAVIWVCLLSVIVSFPGLAYLVLQLSC